MSERIGVWRRCVPTAAAAVFLLAASAAVGAPCRTSVAAALLETQKYAEARALLEPCLRAEARDPLAAEYLGRAILAQHDQAGAISWLERAARLDPGKAEYQVWLGRAYAEQAEHANFLKQASLAGKIHAAFERAVALDPASVDARMSLLEFYLLAPGIVGGSIPRAREQAAEIAARDRLQGYRAAGRIAETQSDLAAASAQYDRAMAHFPQRNEPVYWRENVAVRQKQWKVAFDLMESLLRSKPKEIAPCYQIGRVAALSGDGLARGEECLRLYLHHDPAGNEPALSWAHLRLGNVLARSGRPEMARQEYAVALNLDPGFPEAKEALAKLP